MNWPKKIFYVQASLLALSRRNRYKRRAEVPRPMSMVQTHSCLATHLFMHMWNEVCLDPPRKFQQSILVLLPSFDLPTSLSHLRTGSYKYSYPCAHASVRGGRRWWSQWGCWRPSHRRLLPLIQSDGLFITRIHSTREILHCGKTEKREIRFLIETEQLDSDRTSGNKPSSHTLESWRCFLEEQ